jgi:hypothetical protein
MLLYASNYRVPTIAIYPLYCWYRYFYHYENLCLLQPHCFVTRAPKQLIYNYTTTIPWKYKELIIKIDMLKKSKVVL